MQAFIGSELAPLGISHNNNLNVEKVIKWQKASFQLSLVFNWILIV